MSTMTKPKRTTYNDGVATIYRERDNNTTTFGAKTNVSSINDMDFVTTLQFAEASKRVQDQEFAESLGFSLTIKLRSRFCSLVKVKDKAVIGGYLYDISYIDATNTELFLYCEGVRAL